MEIDNQGTEWRLGGWKIPQWKHQAKGGLWLNRLDGIVVDNMLERWATKGDG